MPWLTPPPRKDKPLPPKIHLPVPKRKGIALLVVALPATISLGIGLALSLFLVPLGRVVGGGIGSALQSPLVRLFFVAGFVGLGVYIGLRTLLVTLMYGALEKQGATPAGGSEKSA